MIKSKDALEKFEYASTALLSAAEIDSGGPYKFGSGTTQKRLFSRT